MEGVRWPVGSARRSHHELVPLRAGHAGTGEEGQDKEWISRCSSSSGPGACVDAHAVPGALHQSDFVWHPGPQEEEDSCWIWWAHWVWGWIRSRPACSKLDGAWICWHPCCRPLSLHSSLRFQRPPCGPFNNEGQWGFSSRDLLQPLVLPAGLHDAALGQTGVAVLDHFTPAQTMDLQEEVWNVVVKHVRRNGRKPDPIPTNVRADPSPATWFQPAAGGSRGGLTAYSTAPPPAMDQQGSSTMPAPAESLEAFLAGSLDSQLMTAAQPQRSSPRKSATPSRVARQPAPSNIFPLTAPDVGIDFLDL